MDRPDPPEEGLGHLGLQLTYPLPVRRYRLVDLAEEDGDE